MSAELLHNFEIIINIGHKPMTSGSLEELQTDAIYFSPII